MIDFSNTTDTTTTTTTTKKQKQKRNVPNLFIQLDGAGLNPYFSSPPRSPFPGDVYLIGDDDAFSDSDIESKNQPMTLTEFEDHVVDLHANTDYLFSEEYTVSMRARRLRSFKISVKRDLLHS